jgi:hypothetical protein
MKSSDEDDFRTNRSSDENSPKTLASSQLSTGEGASALSTPCCLKTGENSTSSANKRNNFTFDGSDTFAEEDFAVIFDKMTQSDKKKTISLRNLYLFKKKDDTEYENNQGSFSLHSHFESEDELSDESVNREEQERRDIDNVTFNPDYGTARKWSGTNEYYEQNQIAEQSINMNSKFCKVISSVSSPQKCDKYKTSSQQYRYTFEAPSTGKLGIIIAGSLHPTVHSVKSYSPLFGKVDVGDVIKSIDGESTLHMTISDITRLIDLRRSIATNGSQKIKITVMSNSPKPDLQNDIQLKVDENTEHGTFVERIEEFGATIQLSYSDDRDNSSCHLIGHLGEDDSSEDSGYLKNL